ncbi:hypothetical protein N4219_09535 [Yersinia enterocolitica]|uniref:hypothetical protein n=1 Tax=Yersinia enterocolitica TaxID=630 RepID=UPI0021E94AB3|nr:hypothetical protein [Yersinia enterocolitica]UYJ82694.1 hypothetical protein N4219_09535 [Yersinia enterocolitica]HDL8331489.1 hypothetical protein [Yersinia enterocolitica]HDM8455718.1 hypothetical protein [Yersinia enterocolitica]HEN3491674.1 hypothetical protein [Yersinia enterocolitica]
MADENTGLVVIDIKPESYPTLYVTNGLDKYLDQIRQAVNEVPDVTTAKGRARIASLAASASRSKTAIEKPGREYLRHLKEQPKIIEAELRRFVIECDEIRDETRRPLTEWEAEQERLKLEAEAKKKAEELAAEIEVAHEMALLMNDAFDRDAKAKADEIERLRKAHEEFIAQQAAEKAKREVEEKAKRDIEAAEQRERDAKLAQERAEQTAKDAAAKAERDAKELAERVGREKQEAIDAEKRKAQQEAERVQREAKQKEDVRLAEEKRVADEAAARAANEAHRKTVGTAVVNGLIEHAGLTREQAIVTLCAIKDSKIPHTNIHY